jgi:hypothetical protein
LSFGLNGHAALKVPTAVEVAYLQALTGGAVQELRRLGLSERELTQAAVEFNRALMTYLDGMPLAACLARCARAVAAMKHGDDLLEEPTAVFTALVALAYPGVRV